MDWINILKADPCTLEAKERLYRVLEKMGANNDLLHSFKDLDSEELRSMIEEFSTTAMESQRPMFKQMLRDWDMCLVQSHRNPNAPPISSEHSQESMMYKSKVNRIFLPAFKEGVKNTVNSSEIDGRVYDNVQFYEKLREEYGNAIRRAMELGTTPFSKFPSQHIKHKTEPEKIAGKLSMVMKSLGFKRVKSFGELYWERV